MLHFELAAATLSLAATIGHFTMGHNKFLKPIKSSDAEIIPKRIMVSVFHYMSFFMIFTTVLLFCFSEGYNLFFHHPQDVMLLFSIVYAGFALVQIVVALRSPIKLSLLKLFQWIFWVLISLFCYLGAL